MNLSIGPGLGDPHWREAMWIEIFDRARKRGRIIDTTLGDHHFQYALINPVDGYGRGGISTSGEIYDYRGGGYSYVLDKRCREGRRCWVE